MKHSINSKRITTLPQVLILVLLVLGFSSPAYSNYACTLDSVVKEEGERINIMLLGDSITQGQMVPADPNNLEEKNFNYRSKLKAELSKIKNPDGSLKYQIKFVGSWSSLKTDAIQPDGNVWKIKPIGDFLEPHEGHWGATTHWFVNGEQVEDQTKVNGTDVFKKAFKPIGITDKTPTLPNSIALFPNTWFKDNSRVDGLTNLLNNITPDVVLIHLGTNDIRLWSDGEPKLEDGTQGPKYSLDYIKGNLRSIINTLQNKQTNGKLKVLLAKIIPMSCSNCDSQNKLIEELNIMISKLAVDLNSEAQPVCIVDQFTTLYNQLDNNTSSNLYWDQFHPKQTGADLIAKNWFNALMGEKVHSLVGDKYNFEPNDANDTPFRSETALEIANKARDDGGWGEHSALDSDGTNRTVALTHKFTTKTSLPIESATLELRFKGADNFYNDLLVIKAPWDSSKPMEIVMLKDLVTRAELNDGKLKNNTIYTANVDLSKVPVRIRKPEDWGGAGQSYPLWENLPSSRKSIMNWLPELKDGLLDIVIADDTNLDYSELTITYAINQKTPTGNNVVVSPHPDVYVKFDTINTAGETTVEKVTGQSAANFSLGDNAVFYEIKTSAELPEGSTDKQITIQFHYSTPNPPTVFHNGTQLEVNEDLVDEVNKFVTVKVASLSIFALVDSGSWQSICKPQEMEITGIGMGDRYSTTNPQTLLVNNSDNINRLLAQVTGRYPQNQGEVQPGEISFDTNVGESLTLTEPSFQSQFGYSYISPLQPTSDVTATVLDPGKRRHKTPRGLVLYTLRDTQGEAWSSIGQILNEYIWGGGSDEDVTFSKTITFPPLQETTDLYVTAVVIDNDNDLRSMVVDAEAGGVTSRISEDAPTEGNLLNIVELKLPSVPSGTTEAVTTLRSPAFDGDSLIFSGLNVSYPCAGTRRVHEGLEALYRFQEGSGKTVQDVSGIGTPLNLTIADESATTWLAGGGLAINTPTIIQSVGAASKVNTAIQASNELTIEAWIKPANVTQDGPARIVTLSQDTLFRNLTLGQGLWGNKASDVYDVRLRATSTSLAGVPSLTSSGGSATTNLTHVVYTRDALGLVRLYLDNVEVRLGRIPGDLSNWNADYALALGNELSQNRPWLGELHLVAIYSKGLSSDQVAQNYTAGSGTTR